MTDLNKERRSTVVWLTLSICGFAFYIPSAFAGELLGITLAILFSITSIGFVGVLWALGKNPTAYPQGDKQ